MKNLSVFLILFQGYLFAQGTWTKKANFGGGERYGAVGFSIGDTGYITTGANASGYLKNDLWRYNPGNNTWSQRASIPGNDRRFALGFSIGNSGYLGGGEYAPDDFWQYNPGTNSRTSKAPLGGGYRKQGVGFSIGNYGYIAGGVDTKLKDDFWRYDPANNIWEQRASFPAIKRHGAVAFSVGGYGYIGMGSDSVSYFSDFWRYDPLTDTWLKIADFPGEVRVYPCAFTIGNYAYVGTGVSTTGAYLSDMYRYDPSTNAWSSITIIYPFESKIRALGVAFSIAGKGYMGTGQNIANGILYDFWQYTPAVTALNGEEPVEINSFPNPGTETIQLNFKNIVKGSLIVYDPLGRKIKQWKINNLQTYIADIQDLFPGIYLLQLEEESGISMIGKFIKE